MARLTNWQIFDREELMNIRREALLWRCLCLALLFLALQSNGAFLYVDLNSTNPTIPFSDWSTAATNIQDAIDAASDGDTVLVTNGIYSSGGRVMSGDLTNRVALNKPITVQSVNGPFVTIIQGASATNGNSAVRCAWLTNGATLVGFTLQGGATRSNPSNPAGYGGGAWCASTSNSIIANCIVRSNTATWAGGGAFQGILRNCFVSGNGKPSVPLGVVTGSILYNCTVCSNATLAIYGSKLTNCIVRFNYGMTSEQNYSSSTFSSSDTYPLPSGDGNTTNDPQFFQDGIHLNSSSPCVGAGTNVASGTDLFGQSWMSPPSMGCAETPAWPLVTSLVVRLTGSPTGFTIGAQAIGQGTLAFAWLKDGSPLQDNGHYFSTQTTNLVAVGINDQDAGTYQLVVNNSSGSVTSAPAPVVIHFVDAGSPSPVSPFTSWSSAATTIQDGIDSALSGEIVLVTNGLYSTGGKSMTGDLTNRVTIDKPLLVLSVNGWQSTTIQGAWDPISTNGPLAVRCVWMTNGAMLAGFTIQNGATLGRSAINYGDSRYGGGGVWSSSTNSVVSNCVLTNNSASVYGAGAAYGTLNNCLIAGNYVMYNGGALAFGVLNNCSVINNYCLYSGGGAAGVYLGDSFGLWTYLTNCIVVYNYSGNPPVSFGNYGGAHGNISSSCSDPLPSGTGNIDADPQFLDSFHISATSPCRGAGFSASASGTDIDGESWASPPSMGCDEVLDADLIGPLAVSLQGRLTNSVINMPLWFTGSIVGRASRLSWNFGDGPLTTNLGYYLHHTWTNPGDYSVVFTAYNNDNPSGTSTNLLVHIVPILPPVLQSPAVLSNTMQFQFYGQPNAVYEILTATNLSTPSTNWGTLRLYNGSDALLQVSVPYSPTNPAQFYRVQPWTMVFP